MRIIYSPFYSGNYYMNMHPHQVMMDVQVLETQGLLSQLALHAGIHQQIPSYPERLAAYHSVLLEYDASHPDNLFHSSISIDSISVAKSLLLWRDTLALCGWNSKTSLDGCTRLNELASIDSLYHDDGLASLLAKLSEQIESIKNRLSVIPSAFRELTIEIPCIQSLLPDYLQPFLNSLKELGVTIQESSGNNDSLPQSITEYRFSQQWKAEVWLAQQAPEAYNLWINTNNKRLDNWLHLSGYPVCGSQMTDSNPQITQLFLLAVQLFQRPLNIKTLLRYLSLPLCPVDWGLRKDLIDNLISEGGFFNDKIKDCMSRHSSDEHYSQSVSFLPFDLSDDSHAVSLINETDTVDRKAFADFIKRIGKYSSDTAGAKAHFAPNDARIQQLMMVSELCDSLLKMIDSQTLQQLSFAKLIQWAQALYESSDYTLFDAQTGSRPLISRPQNMISDAESVIWCDFYGDINTTLSTDFLSPYELDKLKQSGVLLWDRQNETDLKNQIMSIPFRKAKTLSLVICNQCGSDILPSHPLYFQLPEHKIVDGDELYKKIATGDVRIINNHREQDSESISFDSAKHPVQIRNTESFTSLDSLVNTPFDYFMQYELKFRDVSESDIKLAITYGNIAHETIEILFTADRGGKPLSPFVAEHYNDAFQRALLRKGALMLLPEYHFDKDRLQYQLKKCVDKLAEIIQANGLVVIGCEQKEEHDLGLDGHILITGFIDMVLKDSGGNKVVFDLKWSAKKDKFSKLAIYKEMLDIKPSQLSATRTAFFVMPQGKLFSTDVFIGDDCETIKPKEAIDILSALKSDYRQQIESFKSGEIETKMDEYSDYKCFTI